MGRERAVYILFWVARSDQNGDLPEQVLSSQPFPNIANPALDIDEKSFNFAKQNVEANNLQHRIKLLHNSPDGPLLPLDAMRFEK